LRSELVDGEPIAVRVVWEWANDASQFNDDHGLIDAMSESFDSPQNILSLNL
jgi:hypothetical protein